MAERFHELLESLRAAAHHLLRASEETHAAGNAVVRVIAHAREEREDVRETLARLEILVLGQVSELGELKAEVAKLRERLNAQAASFAPDTDQGPTNPT